jgi:hypothetical protein
MNVDILISSIGFAASFIGLVAFYVRTDGTEFPLFQSLIITTNSILLIQAIWNHRN